MAGLSQRVTDSSPKTARAAGASAVVQGRSTSRGVVMVAPSMLTRCGVAMVISFNGRRRMSFPGLPVP